MKISPLKTYTILANRPNQTKWHDLGIRMQSLREVKRKMQGMQCVSPHLKMKISEV